MTCEKQSWCLSSGQPNSETWETNRFGHLAYSASLTLPFPPFLVAQWFRTRPPMQRTRAQPLVWGGAMCGGTVKPVRLERVLRSKRRHHDEEPADLEQRTPCAAAKAQGSQKKKKKRPEPHEISWSHNALYLSEGLAAWTAPSRNLNGLLLGGIQNSDTGEKTKLDKASHWQRGRPSWNWELRASFWNAVSPAQFRVNSFLTSS